MRGIATYAGGRGDWHVYTAPEGQEDSLFFAERFRWDGLILRPSNLRVVRRFLRLNLPTVALGSASVPGGKLPRVKVDDDALARMAVEHFLRGGARRLAYCSFFPAAKAEARGTAFAAAAARAAMPVECLYMPAHSSTWPQRHRRLCRWLSWLAGLGGHVGLLTWNPDVACQVIEACHAVRVRVPESVAVLSGDEDTVKLTLTRPAISAIPIPAGEIGYRAAQLLDQLMADEAPGIATTLVAPDRGIVLRASSRVTSHAERDVYRTLDLMATRMAELRDVAAVAREAGVSRRWLERHFRRLLGDTPAARYRQLRVDRARHLLQTTDLPVKQIANVCGFATPSHLHRVFAAATGEAPGLYRSRHRRS